MIALFSTILLLDLFCLFHAYSHSADQKWYFWIIFFPVVGSLFYLHQNYGPQRNLDILTENVNLVVKDNYKLEQLRKELNHSDSVANKVALADELFKENRFEESDELLSASLNGVYKDDVALIKKLIASNYHLKKWKKVIDYAERCLDSKLFSQSMERVYYAWAGFNTDNNELAGKNFEAINIKYSNYVHRLEYAKYLSTTNNHEKSLDILEELLNEIDQMESDEKRMKSDEITLIRNFYKEQYNRK